MKIFIYSMIYMFLFLFLLMLIYMVSFSFDKSFSYKGCSFECGFQPFSGTSFSFSMPFFVISLMFLIFDVEVLLVCFYPLFFSFYSGILMWLIVVAILLATLYEWLKGVLSWI